MIVIDQVELWRMVDELRGPMNAAEYKHVVLGLIFLKYISDAFEKRRDILQSELTEGVDPEDPDEYRGENIFWIPRQARWERLCISASQPDIGQLVEDAMISIERENMDLKNIFPKNYDRRDLSRQRLGQLIDVISQISVGDKEACLRDVFGRVYEYFLSQFANTEGKKGGEFYTPRSIAQVLVKMLEPDQGTVYDPCCGSSGMFVQSIEFIDAQAAGNSDAGKANNNISIYGQESDHTTWRLAKMNLAIRGIRGRIKYGDSFHCDQHPDLKADFILANPPFNVSDWGGESLAEDKRWRYGVPPKRNANFAWIQHIVYHLAPGGSAGFVLPNESMSFGQKNEAEIRKNLIEAGLVDCIVALPGQLFYSTQIPACLWFISRKKHKREGGILFIDTRKLGRMVDGIHRELTRDEISNITGVYHAWRGGEDSSYEDISGFCKSATLEEIREHGYVLAPGRYIDSELEEKEDELFEDKMKLFISELREQQLEGARLDAEIKTNLSMLGFSLEESDKGSLK